MKHVKTAARRAAFEVVAGTRGAQAAVMILQPGQTSGAYENEHPDSEQWLFVVSGSGRARVNGRSVLLRARSLLLIEKREKHQIINTGRRPLVTLNWYAPPAYTPSGELRER